MPNSQAQLSVPSVDDVLKHAKETYFANEHEKRKFMSKHKKWLSQKTRPVPHVGAANDTVLHTLAAKYCSPGELVPFEPFLKLVFEKYKHLLHQQENGCIPLHVDIQKSNNDFVQMVLDKFDDVPSLLSITGIGGLNCVHIAVNCGSRFTNVIINKAQNNHKAYSAPNQLRTEQRRCMRL